MTWVPPVRSAITSPWGPRDTKIPGASTFHRGTDLRAPTGTPIVAPAAGTVTRSTWAPIRGHVVEIDHGDVTTRHQHLSRRDVARGQQVAPGQTIGAAGATGGLKIAAHLHTEVLLDGVQIDPEPFYAARGAALGPTSPRSWFDMATEADLRRIVREEIAALATQLTPVIATEARAGALDIMRSEERRQRTKAVVLDALAQSARTATTPQET